MKIIKLASDHKTKLLLLSLCFLSACVSTTGSDKATTPLGPLTLTQRVMVPEVSGAKVNPSLEHVVVNSASPDARQYAKDSAYTSREYRPTMALSANNWVVLEKPSLKPTDIEAVAGYGMQDGLISSVYFDLNEYEIKSDADVSVLADKLKNIQGKIAIFGFTDPTGSETRNKVLAADRANATKQKLVELGINEDRIKASGGGISRLYADNARNRRAAIFLAVD